MKNKIVYLLAIIVLFISSCEDDITNEIELAPNPNLVVIDAWVDNKPEPQVIQLSAAQTYFDSTGIIGLSGANVTITEDETGVQYVFEEGINGAYVWTPTNGETFGEIGQNYTLSVELNGITYSASSAQNRVPPIDSVTFRFEEEEPFFEEGYYAQFWARDPAGEGDTYWIKTWVNGEFLREPDEINIAFDAGFSRGGGVDGLVFIRPIRENVNRFEEEDGKIVSPYNPGDSIFVELHAITNETFDFLSEVIIQTDRPGGFAELFSTPLGNSPTNIVASNGDPVLGFFSVSAVSSLGNRLE